MIKPKRLLAKSYDRTKYGAEPPDYALLLQHSRDVAEACGALADAIGLIALRSCEIDAEDFDRFRRSLKANGWIQDLGKANSHFQTMVTTEPQIIQLVRHETVSGMLMWFEPRLRQWLEPLFKILLISLWGAMGHHRKFDEATVPAEQRPPALTVHLSHDDFKAILQEIATDLQLDTPPVFDRDLIIARDNRESCDLPVAQKLIEMKWEFEDCESQFAADVERRMLALIKCLGICADVAASAIAVRDKWATKYSLSNIIHEELSYGLKPQDLSKLISNWAWARSDDDPRERNEISLPPKFKTRKFQDDVAASESFLTLAQAGCGSGKSLAAYLWARNWCEKFEVEGRTNFRLFFCLPTTGTTTEHFKDYALESGIDASLTHSRSRVDLKAIAETALQEEASESNLDAAKLAEAALNAERDKIDSLALWSTPLAVTTADTILGLMSNARRAVYSLPAIISSAIVFDEIHAFDDQMFGHLLVFLKHFPRLPVLLMTASLPDERKRAIKRVRPDLNPIPGPSDFELLERYLIQDCASNDEAWQAIEECLNHNGKVLWVRNRVDWANDVFIECRSRFPEVSSNVYHSRFRYKDRSVRHRRVIDDFKGKTRAAILVATQVAEMSLDLSADLLITDIAPIPSLIQRMGRLNRHNAVDPKPAMICALPENVSNIFLPYDKDEIKATAQWISALKALNKPLNQRNLAETFVQFNDAAEYNIVKAEERACFFSGLWRTRPSTTRTEGHTISVILKADLENCDDRDRNNNPTKDWLRQHEVSIPIKDSALCWDQVGGVRVAPSDQVGYDFDDTTKEGTGARWLKN